MTQWKRVQPPPSIVMSHVTAKAGSPPAKDGPGLRVSIQTPAIETPWRVRVGDRVGTLAGRHRGLACMYGAADGHEGLWCRRAAIGDGWRDTLQYTISMRPLGADRSLVQGEIDLARIAHLPIESIEWQPAVAAAWQLAAAWQPAAAAPR